MRKQMIPLNSSKYFIEVHQTFYWSVPNIPLNSSKHCIEVLQTFHWSVRNIPLKCSKHSVEVFKAFRWSVQNIPLKCSKHSIEVLKTFYWSAPNIPRILSPRNSIVNLIAPFSLSICNVRKPKNLAQSVTLLTCSRQAPFSNLAQNSACSHQELSLFSSTLPVNCWKSASSRGIRLGPHNFKFIILSLSWATDSVVQSTRRDSFGGEANKTWDAVWSPFDEVRGSCNRSCIVWSIKAAVEKSKPPSIDLQSPTGSLHMHFAGGGKWQREGGEHTWTIACLCQFVTHTAHRTYRRQIIAGCCCYRHVQGRALLLRGFDYFWGHNLHIRVSWQSVVAGGGSLLLMDLLQ
jgi:hypothetical protein